MAQSRGKAARAPESRASLTERANAGAVTVISGTISGAFIQIANDLSFVLDQGDELRILPMIGKGAEQNLRDILLLRGIDIGIVRSDGLDDLKKGRIYPGADQQIRYIVKLFNDEAHLIAAKDVTDIRQLAGKRVNFDLVGSGANYSGRLIFERLGVPVEAINVGQPDAYEMLRKGEIAATFQMSGKPIQAVARLDLGDKAHLIEVPYDPRIADLYLPASFTAEDYPRLVASGRSVSTVAVSSILAVYNHPEGTERYRKVARFVDALFSKLPEFQKPPRHPKWAEVNLAATIPGWQRFKPAQEWLERAGQAADASAAGQAGDRASFDRFLTATGRSAAPSSDRERLFREFVDWQRRQSR